MKHQTSDSNWRLLLYRPVRNLPTDLASVLLFVIVVDLLAIFTPLRSTPLFVVLGLPMLLFVPGYVLVAAAFPGRSMDEGDTADDVSGWTQIGSLERRGVDNVERVALSFAMSLVLVPLFGLALSVVPWGIELVPVLAEVTLFTALVAFVAAVRRLRLPEQERFSVSYKRWVANARAALFDTDSRLDAALNVAVVLGVVIAMTSVGYALAAPQDGESFSQLYLATENEEGELVTGNYPTEFTRGEQRPITVGIENHESQAVEYTVVTKVQRIRGDATVVEEQELTRFNKRLSAGETWKTRHQLQPTMVGEDLRVVYLLYKGTPPDNPSVENADQFVHIWISVSSTE